MAEGLSFESFAGLIKVHVDTLYEWVKIHKEFSEAKKIGTAASLLHWEREGLRALKMPAKEYNAAIWIYTMKCRFRKFGYLTSDGMPDDGDGFEFDYG